MAAAAAATATMIYTWVRYGKPDVSKWNQQNHGSPSVRASRRPKSSDR